MTAVGDVDILVVDWLGRGGIAQAADEWVHTIAETGATAHLVTRTGRELDAPTTTGAAEPFGGRLGPATAAAWHARLIALVVKAIRRRRPAVVVVHNYHHPVAELAVVTACRHVGARLVVVAHNGRPHDGDPPRGIGELLRRADDVVCHSRFVADQLRADHRVTASLITPLPVQRLLVDAADGTAPPAAGRRCLETGIVGRPYKGGSFLIALAAAVPDWEFRLAGRGATAPVARPTNVSIRPEYLTLGDMRAEIAAATVVAQPYRAASQSGIIVSAHVLGAVPIAHAVGGLSEQIDDGVDGLLLPPDADAERWRTALAALDEATIAAMSAAGARRAEADDARFRADVRQLLGVG